MSSPDPETTGPPAADSAEDGGELSQVRLGEFLLLRRLGSGGMSDVYLAEQTSLGRPVAVKILKPAALAAAGDVSLQRFEQEARAAGGLNHPHIVQILTTGRERDVSYIVQEYVAGLNLAQWIRKHGSPDLHTGLEWMQQIAGALHAAASAGIVHRDVKPENIMITHGGIAKITDFGLARLARSAGGKTNLTQAGTTLGTPLYMSPEQIQGEPLDHRSDQYSLGVTCYQMFAGQAPFSGRNAMAVAVQHLQELPLPLASHRRDLPTELCRLIHRMLEKDAGRRFQDPGEMAAALKQLERMPVRYPGSRSAAGAWARQFLRRAPELRRIASVAVALLLIGIVTAWSANRPVPFPEPQSPLLPVKEASAARQFAAALLNPRSRGAWKAVMDHFPGTREAELAQLRLALVCLNSPVPDFAQAIHEFQQVEELGHASDRSELSILGLLGQAFVRHREGRESEARDLLEVLEYVLDEAFPGTSRDDQLEFVLSQGPTELAEFLQTPLPRPEPPPDR